MAGRTINYLGNEQIYNKEKVDELLDNKQDKLEIDKVVSPNSTNPVENKAIAKAIKTLEDKHDADMQLEADTRKHADDLLEKKHDSDMQLEADTRKHADDLLEERIDGIEEKLLPMDEVPMEGSEKPVKSHGIFDAIRFASVRVGETMYWHLQDDSSPENREVHSNNPFVFSFKGQEVSVETRDGNVQLCVLKDIPDGWHALDGKAELLATDYPDLAAFMPENVTKDGKIWLPYVQHKIIKVKY